MNFVVFNGSSFGTTKEVLEALGVNNGANVGERQLLFIAEANLELCRAKMEKEKAPTPK